jgi:hypothetical protein
MKKKGCGEEVWVREKSAYSREDLKRGRITERGSVIIKTFGFLTSMCCLSFG